MARFTPGMFRQLPFLELGETNDPAWSCGPAKYRTKKFSEFFAETRKNVKVSIFLRFIKKIIIYIVII